MTRTEEDVFQKKASTPEDTKRLDWLEANSGMCRFRAGNMEFTDCKWNIYDTRRGRGFNRDSLREAIDAARQEAT